MADETIRDGWDSYDTQVLPANAHAIQRSECRRAFYAGAWTLLQMMKRLNELPDEECGRAVERIDDELRAFNWAMDAGRS
jgi:hypothetical protein